MYLRSLMLIDHLQKFASTSAQNSFDKIKNEAKIEDASIKLYDGLEHSATEEELMDVVAFLQRCIKENGNSPEL